MFLIAFTHARIEERFRDPKWNSCATNVESLQVAIVTDRHLSQCRKDGSRFSVIESPLIHREKPEAIILSQVTLDEKKKTLSVHKPTHSGRPIYYHLSASGEFYCSTHISMLRRAGVPVEENTVALPEFFVYRYVTPPKTLYKRINQLCVGSTLCLKIHNNRCILESVEEYDPFPSVPPRLTESTTGEGDVEEISTKLFKAIDRLDACRERTLILLSGGLDSSILFAVCKRRLGVNSSGSTAYPFGDACDDPEKEYALSAARALAADHVLYETDKRDYLYGLLESISATEEPLHHLQSVALYLLFKNGLLPNRTVLVSGQGADGVFGLGIHNSVYKWHLHKHTYGLLSKRWVLPVLRAGSRIAGRGGDFVKYLASMSQKIGRALEDPSSVLFSLGAYGDEKWAIDYFNARKSDVIANRYEAIRPYEDRSIYDVLSMLDLVGDIAVTQSIWSKLGERQGRILYYPFSDRGILDTTFSIKWMRKLKEPKSVLRGVARALGVPGFIVERKKSAFGANPDAWARKGAVFEPLVPLAAKCIDKKVITRLQGIEPRRAMTFWNILNYAIWKRLCVDNERIDLLFEELSKSIADSAC